MFIYSQLNNENIVVGISELNGEVTQDYMINITDLSEKPELGFKYDIESGKFLPPKITSIAEPTATLEEIAQENLLETKYQSILLEALL